MYVQPTMPPRPPLTIIKLSGNFGLLGFWAVRAHTHVRVWARSECSAQNARGDRGLGGVAPRCREATAVFSLRQAPMYGHGTTRDKTGRLATCNSEPPMVNASQMERRPELNRDFNHCTVGFSGSTAGWCSAHQHLCERLIR
jgi:hypothetical protein